MYQVSSRPKSLLKSSIVPQLLTALAVLSLSSFAHADNIVVDGGFESAGGGNAYSAGSNIGDGVWNVTLGQVGIDSGDPYVYDGNNALNLGAVNPYTTNTVSQALTTIVGDVYTVSFYGDADSANTFSITENGAAITNAPGSIADNGFADLSSASNPNASEFVDYTGTFVATSDSTMLDLSTVSDPSLLDVSQTGSVMIDDVSVQVVPTPEPGSIVLMLTGMAGLGLLAAKKRLFGASMVG